MENSLSTKEFINEVIFYRSMKMLDTLKNLQLITLSEFEKSKLKLIEKHQPFLAELMS